jgi:hypothetical protein
LFGVEQHIRLLPCDAKTLLAFVLAAGFPIQASNFAFEAARSVLSTTLPWFEVASRGPYYGKVFARSG